MGQNRGGGCLDNCRPDTGLFASMVVIYLALANSEVNSFNFCYLLSSFINNAHLKQNSQRAFTISYSLFILFINLFNFI